MDRGLPHGEFTVAREYDLPPAVVWDALTDPALLEGWLGAGISDAEVGGTFVLDWLDPHHHGAAVAGEIVLLEPRSQLLVRAMEYSMAMLIDELPHGARGSSTRLTLSARLPAGRHSEREEIAHWRAHLEALEDLLRGHPVVWERWDADYGEATRAFLAETRTTAR
ncbi:SRPBCC domain-containing protein [Lysobacter korlensis]|uniref:SRPBCC domain-containing protein n=1 Tax=Lysobacter korlensis TaxID=553636 RepID=A0ABV6RY43_9GAMM